jgi:hypothetical protein
MVALREGVRLQVSSFRDSIIGASQLGSTLHGTFDGIERFTLLTGTRAIEYSGILPVWGVHALIPLIRAIVA